MKRSQKWHVSRPGAKQMTVEMALAFVTLSIIAYLIVELIKKTKR